MHDTQHPTATRDLSGITPSGPLTLGNYLGALTRFTTRQDQPDTTGSGDPTDRFYMVADLHALTTTHDPATVRHLTRSVAATYLAAGIDPDRSTVFVQSHVPETTRLAYLLECTAHVAELARMTQYKTKGDRPGARVSLYTYPCLMAADILLYQATHVPVGDDQDQHVRLARKIASRFNSTYGHVFTIPEPVKAGTPGRVKDLTDPTRKMSKSDPVDAAGCVRVLDHPDVIARKIRRATTSPGLVYDREADPGGSNLLDILASLTGDDPVTLSGVFTGHGQLKAAVTDAVLAALGPVRAAHDELMADPDHLGRVLAGGAARARTVAAATLRRASDAFGLLPA